MADELVLNRSGDVATLTLNRPDKHNAITYEMFRNLPEVVREAAEDRAVKVLVVRGAGEKAFASGADISEFERVRANSADARVYNQYVAAAEQAITRLAKPTIAMVRGYCIGGGCGLALACDLRFADTTARFGITPAKLGIVYSLESTKRLVDLVGPAQAKYILMSGQQIDARRAHGIGLVDELHEPAEFEEATLGFARLLCSRSQYSVRAVKHMVGLILAGQVEDDEETRQLRSVAFDTPDFAEGVRAFREKREPRFTMP
ncbi:MAG: enoyl-CoA hydratase [Streptosporangiales bacterium]|nr:enoyl-CoA hydratase [Streptosporangiales bacterium]